MEVEPKRYAIMIHDGDNKMVVRVLMNGNVEFGEGVTPDYAAKRFWDELSKYIQLHQLK